MNCPYCKTEIELNGDNATATYWMDNEGIFHWECFECEHEWLGNKNGELK